MSSDRHKPQPASPDLDEVEAFFSELSDDTLCLYQYRDENGAVYTCPHSGCEECPHHLANRRLESDPQEMSDLSDLLADIRED